MFEITPLDTKPGEAELLAASAAFMADRLFSKRQKQKIQIVLNTTAQRIKMPVPRDMLMTRRGVFGAKPPQEFTFTVSVAQGMRDAMEELAHEMTHISQAVNGRLVVTRRRVKTGLTLRSLHIVQWAGGRPIPIEQREWHMRPWEIEACRWQSQLVDEFLARATGSKAPLITQTSRLNRLALYKMPRRPMRPPAVAPIYGLPRLGYVPDADAQPDEEAMAPELPVQAEVAFMPAPQIKIDVPGLNAPRILWRSAISNKREELAARGLIPG